MRLVMKQIISSCGWFGSGAQDRRVDVEPTDGFGLHVGLCMHGRRILRVNCCPGFQEVHVHVSQVGCTQPSILCCSGASGSRRRDSIESRERA